MRCESVVCVRTAIHRVGYTCGRKDGAYTSTQPTLDSAALGCDLPSERQHESLEPDQHSRFAGKVCDAKSFCKKLRQIPVGVLLSAWLERLCATIHVLCL